MGIQQLHKNIHKWSCLRVCALHCDLLRLFNIALPGNSAYYVLLLLLLDTWEEMRWENLWGCGCGGVVFFYNEGRIVIISLCYFEILLRKVCFLIRKEKPPVISYNLIRIWFEKQFIPNNDLFRFMLLIQLPQRDCESVQLTTTLVTQLCVFVGTYFMLTIWFCKLITCVREGRTCQSKMSSDLNQLQMEKGIL